MNGEIVELIGGPKDGERMCIDVESPHIEVIYAPKIPTFTFESDPVPKDLPFRKARYVRGKRSGFLYYKEGQP